MVVLNRRRFISILIGGCFVGYKPLVAMEKLILSDEEWKIRLSEEEYYILRQHGTERPGFSVLNNEKRKKKHEAPVRLHNAKCPKAIKSPLESLGFDNFRSSLGSIGQRYHFILSSLRIWESGLFSEVGNIFLKVISSIRFNLKLTQNFVQNLALIGKSTLVFFNK